MRRMTQREIHLYRRTRTMLNSLNKSRNLKPGYGYQINRNKDCTFTISCLHENTLQFTTPASHKSIQECFDLVYVVCRVAL